MKKRTRLGAILNSRFVNSCNAISSSAFAIFNKRKSVERGWIDLEEAIRVADLKFKSGLGV